MIKPVQNQDQMYRSEVMSEHKNAEIRLEQFRVQQELLKAGRDAHLQHTQIQKSEEGHSSHGEGHKSPDHPNQGSPKEEKPHHPEKQKLNPRLDGGQIVDRLA